MTGKPTVYIADEIHAAGITLLKKHFKVKLVQGLNNNTLLKAITRKKNSNSKSTLIIRSVRKVDKVFMDLLKQTTDVKLICTVSAGFDNIETAYALKCRIDIMNVAGANSTSAAEFTMSLILAAAKNIIKADKMMKKVKYDYSLFKNYELLGKTIGIIGTGRIGSKVAMYAKAFGMRILGNDIKKSLVNKYKFINYVSLNTLLKRSDIVTIHTPLDATTKYLINSQNISLVKNNAVIINCSRGGTIEENALIKSLQKRKISYAGIDVFENEPAFNKKFTNIENVILTPHLAGKTGESKKRMSITAAEKIINYYKKSQHRHKLIN